MLTLHARTAARTRFEAARQALLDATALAARTLPRDEMHAEIASTGRAMRAVMDLAAVPDGECGGAR